MNIFSNVLAGVQGEAKHNPGLIGMPQSKESKVAKEPRMGVSANSVAVKTESSGEGGPFYIESRNPW